MRHVNTRGARPSEAAPSPSPSVTATLDLESERQLWDLMRPDETDLRERRRERLAALLRQLVVDYPQLLVVPLAAIATWAVLSLQ